MSPFVSDSFHLENIFKVHPWRSLHQYFIFLWPKNCSNYGHTLYSQCLLIHQLKGIWVVSFFFFFFWLFWIILLSTFTFVPTYVFISLECVPAGNVNAGSSGKSVVNILRFILNKHPNSDCFQGNGYHCTFHLLCWGF